eukprot:NODE_260_length_11481_cov_1.187928.p5 type:complete len:320 gc:universal NODE_260_length_11481_cov_1.187928:5384-4425(-)
MLPFIRKQTNYQIHQIQWIHNSPKLAVLGQTSAGNGILHIYALNQQELKMLHGNIHFTHMPTQLKCMGDELIIAEQDKLSVWDIHDLTFPKKTIKLNGSALCMDVCGVLEDGPPEVAIGLNKKVEIYDLRVDTPVVELYESFQPWCCAFGNSINDHRNIAIGFENGLLKIYDLLQKSCIYKNQFDSGICCLSFDSKSIGMNQLIIGCLHGKAHLIDFQNKPSPPNENPFQIISHVNSSHPCTIWTCAFNPHNPFQFMMSNDHLLQLFDHKMNLIDSVGYLSQQPIRTFHYNDKIKGLCAFGSFDQTLVVLMIQSSKKVT